MADTLENIASLMLIKEERSDRARVYRRAAGDIMDLSEDVTELVRQDRLSDFDGLGVSIREIIEEVEREQKSSLYEALCREYPAELIKLLAIPGIGPKTVRLVYNHLQITTSQQLLEAAENGQLLEVPGIGRKSAANILQAVREHEQNINAITLAAGWECADAIMDFLQPLDIVTRITPVGSLRRGQELINDVDILVASRDEAAVRRRLHRYPGFNSIEKDEPGHICAQAGDIPVEMIIVPEEEYAARLLWCTGSRAHLDKIFADRRLEDYGHYSSEKEIYEAMRLHYIPPEYREDWGEVELSRLREWPEPVRQEDLMGDFHVRLNWEQGASALREMVAAAQAMGYRYMILAIPVKEVKSQLFVREHWRQLLHEIDELNDSTAGFHIVKGIECDIAEDGNLEIEDTYERDADFVVAAVNSKYRLGYDEQTRRLLRAVENPSVDMIARLSGRAFYQRLRMKMDYDAVIRAAVKCGVALEISSRPEYLDMDEGLIRIAKRLGAKMALSSDASCAAELKNIRLGLKMARRAGVMKEDVQNSMSLARLRSGGRE
ncbi:MAG: helix-hairpin-helix domain-containing protein [Syntrophomonadaceae bacterium]|nr:helix-hairpin-helix domain-containing protein [Syntrophomonadaceae bacterium]